MIHDALYDSIVVELDLSATKVIELIQRGYESPKLDYKSEVDHASAGSRLRLVKHVLAMANTAGGYIVIGVTDGGIPEGLESEQARQLDEATIRGWVFGFTTAPIVLAVHNSVLHESRLYVVVAVLPLGDTLAVATRDGQFMDGTKPQFVFRRGDVLVRHGTSSARWTQEDADYLIGRARVAQKEAWLQEFASDFKKTLAMLGGLPSKASKPVVDESAFQKSPGEFEQLLLDLLRGD
jgi:hypothetical protein